jgi:hypothetical protein
MLARGSERDVPILVISELLVGVVGKAVLGYLAQQGVKLALPEDQLRAWLGRDRTQLALQRSLARAMGTFAEQQPEWAASLFDETFLSGPAAPILARCLTPTGAPDPEELATAWATQFGTGEAARQRAVNDASTAAGEFLRLFEAELRQQDEFRPIYDSRALDSIARSAGETATALSGLRADLAREIAQANQKYQISLEYSLGTLVGDNGQQINIFNLYGEANRTLADQIRVHEFETLIRERTAHFVGRDFIFGAIDAWLLNPDFRSGYIVVRGEPGVGKTALLAELVQRRGYVHHFNIGTQNIRSVHDFLTNICAQLIVRYGLAYTYLPPEASDSGFLSRLLAEASESASGSPVVVAVDALDEADSVGLPRGANLLFLPQALPPHVYFVLSTREREDYHLVVDRREDIFLDDSSPENQEDVRRYIRDFIAGHQPTMDTRLGEWQVGPDAFQSTIAERSQGNFMYLVHVLGDILSARLNPQNIENVRNLPRGLREYYRRHWRTMEVQDRDRFEREYKPVILILAAAREPVTVEQIADWTELDTFSIQHVISDWREFLNADGGNDSEPVRYRLYHASFQEFLREDIGLRQQHGIIVDAALGKIPGFPSGG